MDTVSVLRMWTARRQCTTLACPLLWAAGASRRSRAGREGQWRNRADHGTSLPYNASLLDVPLPLHSPHGWGGVRLTPHGVAQACQSREQERKNQSRFMFPNKKIDSNTAKHKQYYCNRHVVPDPNRVSLLWTACQGLPSQSRRLRLLTQAGQWALTT
jgi:hypothetical protein